MEYTTRSRILTQSILNKQTQEYEDVNFIEQTVTKTIRGGYNMIYHKSYEEVMESTIKSNIELKLFNWITNKFTYQRIESSIIFTECNIKVSQPVFSKMVKSLVDIGYLLRVSRGIYRLNPFVYVPFRADASLLQEEWNQLVKESKELKNALENQSRVESY